jgi:hypothetical protein
MWTGDDKSMQSSEGVFTADCCIYGKWNLPELEGGDRRSRGRYVWPGVVLVGVRMKANRDLIVVARLAETHYCV